MIITKTKQQKKGKNMITVSLTALLVSAVLNGAAAPADQLGFYPNTAVVVEVDNTLDTVTCLDFNGEEWSFFGTEDWCVGDLASFIMCDNGTNAIFDDIICDTKYCGFISGYFGYDYSSDLPLAIFE